MCVCVWVQGGENLIIFKETTTNKIRGRNYGIRTWQMWHQLSDRTATNGVYHTFIQLLIYQSISALGKTNFSNSQILADSATLTTDKGRF